MLQEIFIKNSQVNVTRNLQTKLHTVENENPRTKILTIFYYSMKSTYRGQWQSSQ